MSFLMTSLAWLLKGFSIQWTEQAWEAHHKHQPMRPAETTATAPGDAHQLHHPHRPERPH